MGASRKLQGEIDRVLKKVQEGVDVFDSIWNKVYDADNANQKEKFEADLKKEIKKLQRYRDQIKTWIQSSEIKDKKVSASYEQALVDARKQIEREMERFKICEKETKTKAFSKEGLGQQPKTDPKEKAKSETRDWLNNVVGELESQIDSFEAEIEGLSVKKGKTRPPRLTHLETSITRHKAHIMKLELILRLLDNDELSPEQVNDVKDFLDDYVERNQEDFDDFSDVDELYNSLPLDKVDSLEDLVAIGPLSKAAPILGLKTSLASSASQVTGSSPQEHVEDTASQDSNSDIARTPPSKSSAINSSPAGTPTGSHAAPALVNLPPHNLSGASTPSVVLLGSNSARGILENTGTTNPPSPVNLPNATKEEDITSFPGRRPSPSHADTGVRGIGRGGLSSQISSSIPLVSGSVASGNGALGVVPSVSDMAKRNILGADERLGNSSMGQSLVSPLSNRMILSQTAKANDGSASVDSSNPNESAGLPGRAFSPSIVSGMQWRPGSSFQNQNELGQFRGRTEIAPDIREKFLQRLQQVQQQGHSNLLSMPPIAGGNHKQFSSQQQNPFMQQFNSQSSSISIQPGLGLGGQAPGLNSVTSASIQQQPNSIHQQSSQQALATSVPKDADVGNAKVEEQPLQNLPDNSSSEAIPTSGLAKNLMNEDDMKAPYAIDSAAAVSGSLTEPAQVIGDIDLSPGQPLQSNQSSSGLGVIGRRSVSDLGAIGDSLSGSTNYGGMHDQIYNLQMLDAAYYKIPQPKDSERARTYTPKHPATTPASYPQVQAPIVNNPAFLERLSIDGYGTGTDTLFFAFYYQQNTYQQYLAAKELKKQSWRYHRKYNTWFQRHEEPKIATDEFEQGTYVYFDFHIANDDHQHGWCQRIKTEFTFEYNHLEDELMV
ncbi:CCR4-NOT transcription complex subunit 3-like [Durio zibethinus]|uniref:CCR4-NOT transcription complex subunit 3-like n=1 Tax=Durio zibethinus TaxID=66656 RepID=A0A6P5WUS4_DURZI|nr:CCR4-NOT transcription complex subunit 3-like [Durio zibethinus]XP_022719257.1 CCR4-NOT transcription complex subunit 3-like [Durio zibethinus]